MDSGLTSLALASHLLGQPVDANELKRRAGITGKAEAGDIVRAARRSGLKARLTRCRWRRLERLPTPFIALMEHGFTVVARASREAVLVHDPQTGKTENLAPEVFRRLWNGRVILVRRAPDTEKRADKERFGFAQLIPSLLRHRGVVAQVLTASLFVQLFALVTPLFTMVIIDKVLSTGAVTTLNVLILALAAIAVFDLMIGGLRHWLLSDLTNRLDVDLVARVYRHLTHLPMAFHGGRQSGDTVARVHELEGIRQFLTGPSLTAIVDFLFTGVFLAVMFLFSPTITFVVIGLMISVLLLYGLVGPILKRRLEHKFAAQSEHQSFLVESLSGMETLKAQAVEPQMQRRWEEQVVDHNALARSSERLSNGLSQLSQFINKAAVAITLWLAAREVIAGGMTAGQLIALNMMVGRVMAPAVRIAQLFQQIQQTKVSMRRVGEILNTPPEPEPAEAAQTLPPMKGQVAFENVTFRYQPDGAQVLEDVSFTVEPGEVVGVIGASGAGKTSLLRLIQRLYVPEKGRVLVDGVNLAGTDPAWLRRQLGVVMQDSVLFSGTVRENIALGQPDLPIEDVEAAARLAGADAFIRGLPQAYDTEVGERGSNLSQGQRQRIAIARALALDPKLLLFDEPASALDFEAERVLQENLGEIAKGRTVFLVAHRLSTLRIADRILALDNGRLVEDGRPVDLLRRDGPFARLYAAQTSFPSKSVGSVGVAQ